MPRKCTICIHEQREAIEADLLKGGSYRDVAKQWQVSYSALHRHSQTCIPRAVAAAKQQGESLSAAAGDDLLSKVAELESKAKNIGKQAEDKGDLKTALAAIRELTRIIELQARLAGEIKEQTINVLVTSPDWLAMRTLIMQALEQHPTAKRAVAIALTQAE